MNKPYARWYQARFLVPFSVVAALAVAGNARADDSAAEHARKGRIAYDLQDWPLAIQEYRVAYGADQKAEYLFGLGQAQRQNGEFAAAIISFKAYKRMETISAQQGTAAELLITKCEAELSKEEAAAAARKNAQALAQAQAANAAAPAAPAPFSRPAEDRPTGPKAFYEDVLGDTLFVAGAGAAGVGAVMLFGGNSDMKSASSKPTEGAAASAADSAHSKQVLGAVLLPIGGALLATAIWRWVSVGSGNHPATTGLVVGPGFVGYDGQF